MSIGKQLSFILICISLLISIFGCTKTGNKVDASSVSEKPNDLALQEIKKRLSGIWYHSQTISTQKTMQREFSWGVSAYDYWNALCIDLMGSIDYFQYADGGWKKVVINVDRKDSSILYLHLSNPDSPAINDATIKLNGNEMMFKFTNGENTLFAQDVNGKYYKLAGPGTQNLSGVR